MNEADHSRVGRDAVPPARDAGAGEAAAPRRRRLLLVEDHVTTRTAMKLLLAGQGLEVLAAGSMQEALQVAERQPLDLVISDLGLPDGGGEELLFQLRKTHPRLKAIAVTGRQRGDTTPGFGSGTFDARLVKPVDFDALSATIRCLLDAGAPP